MFHIHNVNQAFLISLNLMGVRPGTKEDVLAVLSLYRSFFEEHNYFEMADEQVIRYLENKIDKDTLLVHEENDQINGALFVVLKAWTKDKDHKQYKFRHVAFDSVDAGRALLEHAQTLVQDNTTTAKVEMSISENEEGLEFYEQLGYVKEGELANHYRFGESCYILGKSFK